MSNGQAPFVTKNTLGLCTIDWNNPVDASVCEAIYGDAPAASDNVKNLVAQRMAERKARRESQKLAELEAEHRAALEKEEARLEALAEQERLRQIQHENEEAARIAAEEAARLKAQEETARIAAEIEAAEIEAASRWKAEEQKREEAKRHVLQSTRPKLVRRISFFPATKDNTGLLQVLKRYPNDVPSNWASREHKGGDHYNLSLKHVEPQRPNYSWEKPEWALRNLLKSTHLGQIVQQGKSLERTFALERRHSFSDLQSTKDGTYGELLLARRHSKANPPSWVLDAGLKPSQAGLAARSGMNLALPITDIRDFVAQANDSMNNSFNSSAGNMSASMKMDYSSSMNNSSARLCSSARDASQHLNASQTLNASQKRLGWETPSWVTNPGLKKVGRPRSKSPHI